MHLNGLNTVDPGFDGRLQAAFEAAIEKGLWIGLYASSNRREYFAEGANVWFNAHYKDFHIKTRTKLREYDPELAKLLTEGLWRYRLAIHTACNTYASAAFARVQSAGFSNV